MAKHIIHLILCLRKLIEEDPQVRPWLHVAMVEGLDLQHFVQHRAVAGEVRQLVQPAGIGAPLGARTGPSP